MNKTVTTRSNGRWKTINSWQLDWLDAVNETQLGVCVDVCRPMRLCNTYKMNGLITIFRRLFNILFVSNYRTVHLAKMTTNHIDVSPSCKLLAGQNSMNLWDGDHQRTSLQHNPMITVFIEYTHMSNHIVNTFLNCLVTSLVGALFNMLIVSTRCNTDCIDGTRQP